MSKDEALKMAIEALEMHVPHYIKDRGCDALIACRQALEQPAQEPAYQVGEIVNPYGSNIKIKHPAQEPVAWMHRHAGEITEFNDFQSCQYCEPLYTHPAPSWQGLSDDEIEEALSGTDPNFIHGSCTQGILWAEAKLKEKNT